MNTAPEISDGLLAEIEAYDAMLPELQTAHSGKWVLVHDRKLIGLFESSDAAATEAVKRFGRGPYLIRQIGAPPITLPASVMFGFSNAQI
jgi:hypothetical protein